MSLNSAFLEQNCRFTLTHCNWLGVEGQNCAQEFCNGFPSTSGTCPQIMLDPMNCCGSSDPASCLNAFVHGSGGSGSSGSGSGSGSGSDNPCASVVEYIISCSSANPNLFPSGSIITAGPAATSLAQCMCYDSAGSYNPSALDGYASACVASGSAAHPSYYPYASHLDGFCGTIAAGAPASTPAVATSSAAAMGMTPTGNPSGSASPTGSANASGSSTSSGAAASSTKSSASPKTLFQFKHLLVLVLPLVLSVL